MFAGELVLRKCWLLFPDFLVFLVLNNQSIGFRLIFLYSRNFWGRLDY